MSSGGAESDESIAARAKDGDRGAFDLLVKRHKDGIYRFIRRYVGQADDAYDVLQNCFVAAWSGLGRYDAARPFLPWLRTIALNKCRDFGRRQTVRRFVLSAFATERGEPSTELLEEQRSEDRAETERLAELDRVIAALPAFYKEPLLLTTVSGLSHQEAAALLETTPKAVEMRIYRARRKVIAALGRKGEG
ncbi:MAG: RNA polymerase sigma factor [Alphaproteobacteria bacterium]|nr:RNA polymerase sigma factor [Reyranella sp.]MBL6940059.1 RNA polymerase sigma factor [Alphaproteobacteria bacterium]MBL7100146.1 RNA polymerase sigma factor [Alphaproteobacteria bacterium]